MTDAVNHAGAGGHSHFFLGEGHERGERRTWAVIWLCGLMMVGEVAGGLLFGSIALVADGLHMSTHAGALLLAALAYTYARRHADDPGFTFGTGKLGDLAGFASAVILALISLLIGCEAVARLFAPVPISFSEAIPIACLGLAVNVVSAWLLSGGRHHHDHGHAAHGHDATHGDIRRLATKAGTVLLEVFEDGVPPRFRVRHGDAASLPEGTTIETVRPDGDRRTFAMVDRDGYLESIDEVPEPHAFQALLRIADAEHSVTFEEHAHGADAHGRAHRDNNMRAAIVHVVADAAVSVLVIAGLVVARALGWYWMDPAAGMVGAIVIASWSYGLVRDTGSILLDRNPEPRTTERFLEMLEGDGDRVSDLHLWRLGPGHLGAVISVVTSKARDAAFYRARLARIRPLSHVTIEVTHEP